MEFVKKHKKDIIYCLWTIFIVLLFGSKANGLVIFFIVIAQISLNLISGDLVFFKEGEIRSRGYSVDSSESGPGWSGGGDGGGGDGGGCGGGGGGCGGDGGGE